MDLLLHVRTYLPRFSFREGTAELAALKVVHNHTSFPLARTSPINASCWHVTDTTLKTSQSILINKTIKCLAAFFGRLETNAHAFPFVVQFQKLYRSCHYLREVLLTTAGAQLPTFYSPSQQRSQSGQSPEAGDWHTSTGA